MGCLACGRGFHSECKKCKRGKCHITEEKAIKKIGGGVPGRPLKEPHEMKDSFSTGRKRAAKLYPLFRDQDCEWQGMKNCGGGLHPIVGCINGLQEERQHGPVKDTRNNNPGNVHRICRKCHHRWHVMNDPHYDEQTYRKLPHEPVPATSAELAWNEEQWRKTKAKRDFRLDSTGS